MALLVTLEMANFQWHMMIKIFLLAHKGFKHLPNYHPIFDSFLPKIFIQKFSGSIWYICTILFILTTVCLISSVTAWCMSITYPTVIQTFSSFITKKSRTSKIRYCCDIMQSYILKVIHNYVCMYVVTDLLYPKIIIIIYL